MDDIQVLQAPPDPARAKERVHRIFIVTKSTWTRAADEAREGAEPDSEAPKTEL